MDNSLTLLHNNFIAKHMNIFQNKLSEVLYEKYGSSILEVTKIKGILPSRLLELMKNDFSNAHRYELQIISGSLGMYYFDFEQKFGFKLIPEDEYPMQNNMLKPEIQSTKSQRRKKNKK
jgi:septin family protein